MIIACNLPFLTAWQAHTSWRNRWTIKNSGFRELKEGWHLEEALRTFHNTVVAAARLTFKLIAYNVAQIAKSKAAERLKAHGINKCCHCRGTFRHYSQEVDQADQIERMRKLVASL